ncbi:bifunctional Phosphomannomutase/HAD superfamily/Phosphomannomutase [Babesia duncani]|uniref:Phosphomannomutase n=1 Tax=Babesia duncani TaxID=323732 RepID=A0AAD9UP90_9APIC|nr:bifunctional Phosphomannomutase/HAD superfamily/Phosphomannomutase [Babesia duncani]
MGFTFLLTFFICDEVTLEVKNALIDCKKKGYDLAVVSGSQMKAIQFQLGNDFIEYFDYIFSQNGTQAFSNGKIFHSVRITDVIPNDSFHDLLNFCLHYIADLKIPKKRYIKLSHPYSPRGTFIECREAVVNISPIGRNCTLEERLEFLKLDNELGIREKMVSELEKRFGNLNPPLRFAIGGQISIDCFPKGWDKSYIMKFVKSYHTIHFFGDKTQPGGNDYELFVQENVNGHTVTNFQDTIEQLKQLP